MTWKKTPCTTGVIPETFRKRKEALRSENPVHSLAAIGPKAREIILADSSRKDVLENWRKLLELNGYILLVGVGLGNCTAMHLAERRVQFPKHILKKITPPRWFVEKYPASKWEWDFGSYPDFSKMEEPCLRHGIMKTAKVGGATLKLVRLRELVDLCTEYLEKNPDLFYH